MDNPKHRASRQKLSEEKRAKVQEALADISARAEVGTLTTAYWREVVERVHQEIDEPRLQAIHLEAFSRYKSKCVDFKDERASRAAAAATTSSSEEQSQFPIVH